MASEKVTAMIEEVKALSVLELAELVHALEEAFGVSAAAAAVAAAPAAAAVYEDGSNARCDTVKDIKMYIENIDEMIERKRTLFEVFS